MEPDVWALYALMLRSRFFENEVIRLWNEGKISGELAAVVLEAGISFKFARVCTMDTIPYARSIEDMTLPNTSRILESAKDLLKAEK
jgi:pyruvate/2-oxoglutarate/acetoin dehydrogenase E1 component